MSADLTRLSQLVFRLTSDTTLDNLGRLDLLSEVIAGAQLQQSIIVEQCRQSGVTWSAIGDAIGLSMQGAQQRFTPKKPKPTPQVEVLPGTRHCPVCRSFLRASGFCSRCDEQRT